MMHYPTRVGCKQVQLYIHIDIYHPDQTQAQGQTDWETEKPGRD